MQIFICFECFDIVYRVKFMIKICMFDKELIFFYFCFKLHFDGENLKLGHLLNRSEINEFDLHFDFFWNFALDSPSL